MTLEELDAKHDLRREQIREHMKLAKFKLSEALDTACASGRYLDIVEVRRARKYVTMLEDLSFLSQATLSEQRIDIQASLQPSPEAEAAP